MVSPLDEHKNKKWRNAPHWRIVRRVRLEEGGVVVVDEMKRDTLEVPSVVKKTLRCFASGAKRAV
jgi:hypothetical protein